MEEKKLKCIVHKTITGLIKYANELGIKREDIVSVVFNQQYLLVYYG